MSELQTGLARSEINARANDTLAPTTGQGASCVGGPVGWSRIGRRRAIVNCG